MTLDGIEYTPALIADMREHLIKIREDRLLTADFDDTVLFSHIIAMLAHYYDIIAQQPSHVDVATMCGFNGGIDAAAARLKLKGASAEIIEAVLMLKKPL